MDYFHMDYITVHSSAKESKLFWTVWWWVNHDSLLFYKWTWPLNLINDSYTETMSQMSCLLVFLLRSLERYYACDEWQLLRRWVRKRREQVTLRWKCLPKLLMKYALWLRRDSKTIEERRAYARFLSKTLINHKQEMDYQILAWCFKLLSFSHYNEVVSDWAAVSIKAVKSTFAYEFSWGSLTWTADVCR